MITGPSQKLLLASTPQGQANITHAAFESNFHSQERTPNASRDHEKKNYQQNFNAYSATQKQQKDRPDVPAPLKQIAIGSKIKQHPDSLPHQQDMSRIYENTSTTKNASDETSSAIDPLCQRMSRVQSESSSSVLQQYFKRPLFYESEVFVACKHYSFERKLVHMSSCESITIQKSQLRTADIQKIAIYPEAVLPKKFKFQLFHKADKYVFGVDLRRELYLLPSHYIWFAKIVNAKVTNKGFKLGSENQINKQLKYSSIFCEGNLYKRSKYIKQWKQRYVIITAEGLFSYINRNENYSIFISIKDIVSVETQFEFFEENLVIKMYCSKEKLEFAIPIHDFCLKISSNWLLAFYRLLMEHKYHLKMLRQ